MGGRIIARKRKDGTTGYRADVVIYQEGKVAFKETKTFDRRQAAAIWIEKRSAEIKKFGVRAASAKVQKATLAQAIDRYVSESRRAMGRTKAQVLEAIKRHPIAEKPCEEIGSPDLIAFAQSLIEGRSPATVANYLSHLGAVFSLARPAWGMPLDPEAMRGAAKAAKKLGLVAKGAERDRRPTVDEIARLMDHFRDRIHRRPSLIPMHRLIPFALYSTRRQEEITRIRWEDFEGDRIMVRDMKNPGEKIGNNVRVDLPPEARAIIEATPKIAPEIFPYAAGSISASWTRACAILGIEDLHFHDLRHEGISRLFELGWNIPHVATVSGHRDWKSLKRYTHIRQPGDKWAGDWWK
jgi:integrase